MSSRRCEIPYNGNDETNIITQLQTLGLPVYESETPETVPLSYDQFGLFQPFYIIVFSAPFSIDEERSFNGIGKDPYRVSFVVSTFAPDTDTLRTHRVNAMNLLSGWEPTGCSEIKPEYGRNYTQASTDVRPVMYGHNLLFSYMTNITLD